jgi:predicted Zn-dependent protease
VNKAFSKLFFLIFISFSSLASEYIIMDEESESFLEDIIEKISGALNYKQKISVYISNSQVLNACANQRGDILINAGAILRCSDVCELIAIIAHEVGHIAGSHITAFLANRSDFMRAGLVTMLIGATASILARDAAPLAAGVLGGQNMTQKMALTKLRQKESMADTRSAEAIKKLGWPIFKSFVSIYEKLSAGIPIYNVYESTHPYSADRVAKFRKLYEEEKNKEFDEEKIELIKSMQKKFEIIQTKIKALVFNPSYIIDLYRNPKNNSEKYAKAIALYKNRKFEESEKLIDDILADKEEVFNAANLTEIKAMCLIKRNKPEEAAKISYQYLNQKDTHRDLGIIYADAVVVGELDRKQIKQAIRMLNKIRIKYKNELSIIDMLGRLYSINNEEDKSRLCSAEIASQIGDEKTAVLHARKASKSKNKFVRRNALDILTSCDR